MKTIILYSTVLIFFLSNIIRLDARLVAKTHLCENAQTLVDSLRTPNQLSWQDAQAAQILKWCN